MTAIDAALLGMLVAFTLSVVAALRGDVGARVVAVQLSSVIMTLMIVLVSAKFGRDFVLEVALVLAVVIIVGGLVFARFLERWL
ncbi:MAG TPA: MrpF/PhaF family protein [Nitriliruptorales bacterium]|nr:MrpF/PhaF family protein [Nitriliruptorales bacterium]